jgi:competence protein ComEA
MPFYSDVGRRHSGYAAMWSCRCGTLFAYNSLMVPKPNEVPAKLQQQRLLERISWPRVLELGLAFVLGALTLLLLEYGWRRVGGGAPSAPVEVVCYRIDLNQANRGDLAQLPGIGPALADRIVAHRETNGPFADVEGLREVKGIGPATLDRVRARLQVAQDKIQSESMFPQSSKEKRTSGRKAAVTAPININRATRDELMKLPGVGPVLADRIISDREASGPYRTIGDLKRVKGIKDKMLEKLSPSITVGEIAEGSTP